MEPGSVKRALAAGALVAAIVGVGLWQGPRWLAVSAPVAKPTAPAISQAVPAPRAAPDGVMTVDGSDQAADAGVTPMADRVAVVGILNKRNGVSRELTMKPGQALRVGDTIVRLRACEHTAPWEQDQLTGAFVQLDVKGVDKVWRRVFSGWLFKERPALNVVQHPVYDVWAKSCTMSFPEKGAGTDVIAASTAKKSAKAAPDDTSDGADDAPVTETNPASASPSNAM